MNSASIFDLSPSEKLQLVEDLWDDLAAAPEAVPVHDWQKQELARRKANLLKNPASGLPWEEVDSASIFDLSPPEKLQLGEDLWDDLAAAPEAVPVHDWSFSGG